MNNQETPQLTEQDVNNLSIELKKSQELQKAPNQNVFKEIIQGANLPVEKVKKEIPNLEKPGKGDRIEPVKTASDQEKIDAYDKLQVQDLPTNWKADLARLKYLEGELSNYEKVKEELKNWTDTFGEKKPEEVQGEIKSLEESKEKTETELKEKISELENDLEKSTSESQNILTNLGGKIKDLEKEIGEWKEYFRGQDLSLVKAEIEDLQKRPDLPITEQQFYDDYARRKSQQQSELEMEELEKAKEKITELTQEKERFLKNVDRILENIRTREYVSAKPVITKEQALQAIEELLQEKERKYEDYFRGEGIVDRDLDFELSIHPEKKVWVQQVLEWIKEAKETKDYQKLFERWSGGKEYNREHDFGSGLSLLKKYLNLL